MLKGTVAVLLAATIFQSPQAGLVAGLGAFLGHLFPVWLRFRGGKGVATFLGILIAVNGWVALAFAAIWLAVAKLSKYSSLSALIASVASTLLLWLLAGRRDAAALMAVLTVLLWFMHRTNISRLLAGREGKIGQKG
jgi:acyl phosphate:glycerol-3-phosphate acyltransferase